ncbi:MAG: SLBB domain-containing protein [Gammaproteobacteria bacterium]
MLNMLPAGQREELLRQYRAAQPQRQSSDRRGEIMGEGTPDIRLDVLQDLEEAEAKDPETIQPGDTLVIDIRDPREVRSLEDLDRPRPTRDPSIERHLLDGTHAIQLDRMGQLSLPGLSDIPLAGLNAEQAALRLSAEPALAGQVIRVTRLTLTETGRDALKPFGYEIFRQTQRYPLSTTTVPGDYLVGPGDTVHVALYGREFAEHTLTVSRDGQLLIPTLGPMDAAGMRFSDLRSAIQSRFEQQTIGNRAAVSMGELRAIEVIVLGDVTRPGAYQVNSLDTVLDALYAASGISEIGSLRDIRVLREGAVHGRYDLYDLLLKGNPRTDIRLQGGDVVFVGPSGPRAGVMGEVLRPAWYELGEKTTVGELFAFSGGETVDGNRQRAQLRRNASDGASRVIDIDLGAADDRALTVRPGDVLVVNRVLATLDNALTVRGHIFDPGPREWREGMRLSDLLPDESVLRQNPDLDYALVVRPLSRGHGAAIRTFSPREILADDASPANIVLRARDEVLFFGFDDNIGRRALIDPLVERLRRQAGRNAYSTVAEITGAVRAPGTYPLSPEMRLSDLILAGGGLSESAYSEDAEITRYEIVEESQREIGHVTVDPGRALAGDPEADILLRPHDRLIIKELSLWRERGAVTIRGEVRFPGTYPIRPDESLSAVIERAGGLTDAAYPTAAVFTRATLREKEREQFEQMIRQLESDAAAAGAQTDAASVQARSVSTSLAQQLRATDPVGRLVIDLPTLLQNPGDLEDDVIVHAGDVLVVPSRPQEVTVFGEVYFPTSHIYDSDMGHNDYLERSGGMTYRADTKRVYIVRANGAVETVDRRRGRGDTIRPGDTIVVPIDAERLPPMVRLTNISQILYQLGVAAAAWNTIGVF